MLHLVLLLLAFLGLASSRNLIRILALLEATTLAVLVVLSLQVGSGLEAMLGLGVLTAMTIAGCEAAVMLSLALVYKWVRGQAELRPYATTKPECTFDHCIVFGLVRPMIASSSFASASYWWCPCLRCQSVFPCNRTERAVHANSGSRLLMVS